MSLHYHGISNHNKWIRKGFPCPYCMKGSKPVHESLLTMTDIKIEEHIAKETKQIKSGEFEDGMDKEE